jgi:Alpha 1,4-glycosyltransferase conserved region/Glycosyltransferase sugar-binding region containing DXD motif
MSTIVQSLWIGSQLSPVQLLSISSFVALGHRYHLYAYEHIADIPKGTTLCDASKILPTEYVFRHQDGFGKGSYAAFSDHFRYKLIFEKGGWWVDTDVVCLRPFDFADGFVFATEHEDDYTTLTASCVFRSPARSEYLDYCLQVCEGKDKTRLRWGEIGPYLLDEAVKRSNLAKHCVPVHVFNPINWFEFSEILKPGFDVSRLANSYAVHLWNQMWTNENVDPGKNYPRSLYSLLKERFLGPHRAV